MREYIVQSINLLKVFFLGLFIFSFSRLIYVLRFGEKNIFSNYSLDIFKSFLIGLKFDILILCYIFILIFVLNFLYLLNKPKINHFVISFTIKFFSLILPLLVLVLALDQQFFTYFQTHFNVMVFAFLEDDTKAILASMWADHPVIPIFLGVFILAYIFHKIVKKIYRSSYSLKNNFSKIKVGIGILLFSALFALGLRGSVGLFPLLIDDASVSENSFINNLTANGIFTFIKAIEEKQNQAKPITKEYALRGYNYKNINEAVRDYKNFPKDTVLQGDYIQYITETTKKDSFLAENPPHVVFILMESFGGYYFNFHNEKLNLFGSLENHFDDAIHFSNFLSATRGTIYSLENLLINKDVPILSGTKKRFTKFKSSTAYPFFNAGYNTVFITGGKLGWRNLHELTPNQYYTESYGQATISKNNPKAITNTWGVYDEFLFGDIFNKLKNSQGKPQMVFALSTSNHTPYELPESYKPFPIEVSDSLADIIFCNKETAIRNFTAYQYSNDRLGAFLTKLKASEFGENTIVAVTGDHNSYAVFPYNTSIIGASNNHIVPFMLFVPEKYKKNLHINTNRYGSHKDIFPTLTNLALSNEKYFSLGNDLFDKSKPDSLFYGINERFYFSDTTLSPKTLTKIVNARNSINKYYFGD